MVHLFHPVDRPSLPFCAYYCRPPRSRNLNIYAHSISAMLLFVRVGVQPDSSFEHRFATPSHLSSCGRNCMENICIHPAASGSYLWSEILTSSTSLFPRGDTTAQYSMQSPVVIYLDLPSPVSRHLFVRPGP